MANTVDNKQFWQEFINLYRDLPELWKVKSEGYKNRYLKSCGYDKLVIKMKEMDKDADRDQVRKKINCLRTAYRRELKKVVESTKSGIGREDLYVPSLWYFDEIDFLRDQEYQMQGTSTMDKTTESEEIMQTASY